MGTSSKQRPTADWNDVLGVRAVYSKGEECGLVSATGKRMTPLKDKTPKSTNQVGAMHQP